MTELAKQIVALRAEGLTYPQIQERLGCSKSTISYHLTQLGLQPVPRIRKVRVKSVRKPKPPKVIKVKPVTPTVLTCSTCKATLPLDSFTKNPKNQTSGRNKICKKCTSQKVATYYKNHPSRRQPNKRIRTNYSRHSISKEFYEEMLSKYTGNCWVCQVVPATSIDHDHTCCAGSVSCGKCVRGLLCTRCNMAIGALGDDVDGLMRAVVYLQGTDR